jgi:hypothetical protein
LKDANPENLNRELAKQGYNKEETNLIMQRFGMEDKLYPEPPENKI